MGLTEDAGTRGGEGRAGRRVLVVGATGYLGRHLVAELAARDHPVRALVRRPDQAALAADADEVVAAEATRPGALSGLAAGVDTVYSCLGITRQRDGVGYLEVDYGANLAVLREAERAGVRRVVYVSVLHGDRMRPRVALAEAKERFVEALHASPIEAVVMRPTGFFTDMEAYLAMARRGRAYLLGDGRREINPISGRDLARLCADAGADARDGEEVAAGGPETLTHERIARLAFEALGREPRIRRIPLPFGRAALAAVRLLTPERVHGPLDFVAHALTHDMVAPPGGTDRLAEHFARLAAEHR